MRLDRPEEPIRWISPREGQNLDSAKRRDSTNDSNQHISWSSRETRGVHLPPTASGESPAPSSPGPRSPLKRPLETAARHGSQDMAIVAVEAYDKSEEDDQDEDGNQQLAAKRAKIGKRQ